ncbi:F-box/FBD/LRR-repeat protein At5g56420-like [Mercurialis annua]|uniref:F-box/FBD/LRR-repeat protein At5g56420-like n=1 Tax=Mercurialis annua TaxID=3986 RepID=UPI00215E8D37|nr:F-box/FBD/LRR-repeat protein At5g56420-like [Mercurialis annua]
MVANNRKKIDRISQLPDCLLHHIFSFAVATDVVRTCVLSKRWRYLWTSCPYLNFTVGYDSTEKYSINFINQVLLRRNSIPIKNFVYDASIEVEGSVVESWLYYAVNHQVQRLTINPYCPKIPIEFPKCFYGCTSLTTLKLNSVDHFEEASILLPKTLELPSLKKLHLINFSDFDGTVFSSIPNLETLILENIYFDGIQNNFSVSAPNLKNFCFLNHPDDFFDFQCEFVIVAPKLRKFKFVGDAALVSSTKNLCSLDQIEIDLCCGLDRVYSKDNQQKFAREVLQMFNAFHIAKNVTLSMRVIEVLSLIPSLLNEHPSQYPNLKSLKVKTNEFSKNIKIPSFILDYFLTDSSLLEICWE